MSHQCDDFLDYLLDRGVILRLENEWMTRSGDPSFASNWANLCSTSRSIAVSAEQRSVWMWMTFVACKRPPMPTSRVTTRGVWWFALVKM